MESSNTIAVVGEVGLPENHYAIETNSKFCVHVLETKLRHDNELHRALDGYHRLYSPRFQAFTQTVQQKRELGTGIDIQTFIVYQEYRELVEQYIEAHLQAMNISAQAIFEVIEWYQKQPSNLVPLVDITVIGSLMNFMSTYGTFMDFGMMMEAKYEQLYPDRAVETMLKNQSSAAPVASIITSGTQVDKQISTSDTGSKFVRVLWVRRNYVSLFIIVAFIKNVFSMVFLPVLYRTSRISLFLGHWVV
jgi:hypothetical protein